MALRNAFLWPRISRYARCFSLIGKDENVMNVFDRKAKRRQKNRAALKEDVAVYDYIRDDVAFKICDRISDIARDLSPFHNCYSYRQFPLALDLGCGRGHIGKHITKEQVGTLVQCDMAEKMLEQCPAAKVPTLKAIVDEEFLPFKGNSFDLVVSSLSLHWVNDLPGTFKQVHHCLKEDGAFLGAIYGGDTLFELRSALQMAELEREGGFAPHISPFTEMRDIGNLLTRSGFNLTTIDCDDLTIGYPSMFELMYDLKGMGENNAAWSRKSVLHRDTLLAAASIYEEMYGLEEGGVPATFQILFFIGWKPHPSQQKPARRGSATASLKDISSLNEP